MATLTYKSLEDLPVYNWYKCNEKQDYKYLLLEYDENYKGDLSELYEQFNQEYLDLFGASSEREKIMSILKKLVKHKADYLLGKRHAINYIKTYEYQLTQLGDTRQKPQSVYQLCAMISKFQGARYDPKITTVVEFHEIINLMNKSNGTTTD